MDKLDELFDLQAALNKRIGVDTAAMSEAEKTQWVLNYTRAMQQEIAELVDSVPWKWWAKYQAFDEQNAKVEVVDLFHFLISALILDMLFDLSKLLSFIIVSIFSTRSLSSKPPNHI